MSCLLLLVLLLLLAVGEEGGKVGVGAVSLEHSGDGVGADGGVETIRQTVIFNSH